VKEASGVCKDKDRVKCRAICGGKNKIRWYDMLLTYLVMNYGIMICMYVVHTHSYSNIGHCITHNFSKA
jgi:hypothetical protein